MKSLGAGVMGCETIEECEEDACKEFERNGLVYFQTVGKFCVY